MEGRTHYQLVSRATGQRLYHPVLFTTMTAAAFFAIIHDYRGWNVEPVAIGHTTLPLPLDFHSNSNGTLRHSSR